MSTKAKGTHQNRKLALVVIAAAQLMVMLDLTIVNIALPSIQRELGFSTTNLAWVIDAYVLTFGGLLLLGGRTGDLFGRKRMFIVGIALFTTSSLAGGLATDQGWLIIARAIQGIGAAIASPTALSLITTTFDEGAQRHKAMAVYAGMSAAGGALGLLLGGALVDFFSWRWVLFVNVPIGALLLLMSPKALRETSTSNDSLDLPGAVTASFGMALLVYGLIRVPSSGWTNPTTLGVFLAALIVLIAFVVVEAKTDKPLLPLEFLANRNRSGGYLVMLLLGGAMLSLLFFLTQFLQDILHYSPIDAGFAYLPLPVMVATTSIIVSRQIRRFGTKPFLTIGPLFVAVGLFWASYITVNSSYPAIFGPLVTVGLGMGLTFVTLTLNAVTSVAPHESGLASALLNTSQQIGGSLGLAALVTLMATSMANSLKSAQVIIRAASKANPSATTTALANRFALNASVHGYQIAFKAGSMFALVAFTVAALAIRSAPKRTSDADILLADVKQ